MAGERGPEVVIGTFVDAVNRRTWTCAAAGCSVSEQCWPDNSSLVTLSQNTGTWGDIDATT
jgi:hypothetical protein